MIWTKEGEQVRRRSKTLAPVCDRRISPLRQAALAAERRYNK